MCCPRRPIGEQGWGRLGKFLGVLLKVDWHFRAAAFLPPNPPGSRPRGHLLHPENRHRMAGYVSQNHFPVDHSTDCPRALSSPASLSVDQPGVHTRRASTVTPLRVHNPNLSDKGVRCLLVLAEEVVVSSIRHEPLVTYVGGGAATVGVVGGRSPFCV